MVAEDTVAVGGVLVDRRRCAPQEERRIRQALVSHPGVDEVLDLRTMYVGPESLLVTARVDLADDGRDAEAIEHLANEFDAKLRKEVPAVSGFPRPDAALTGATSSGLKSK